MLRWIQSPPGRRQVGEEAAYVLSAFEPIWRVLWPRTIQALVQQLVWEVRWDASHDRFEVMLDDLTIHEHAEELRRSSDGQAAE